MLLFRLTTATEITAANLTKYIDAFKNEKMRREKLFDYYIGKHSILNRTYADASKVNNKVVSPWAHNITDFATGYFVGEPVRYDNTIPAVDDIIDYNDDAAEIIEIAKNASICGVAYELQFIDKYGELRYISINPTECFAVYDTSLDAEIKYFIRSFVQHDVVTNKDIEYATVYDAATVSTYRKESNVFKLVNQLYHGFDEVPVVEYRNNPEQLGDFETVLSLIDAYDTLISNSVNDSSEFSDAYLLFKGVIAETEDIDEMKRRRVLCIDTDADAKWLTKDVNSTFSEDMKNRIANEIHKFSNVPDMTDANFAANASGVAMKYKLLGLEDITAKKENEFKRGLVRRFEIMSAYLSKIGYVFPWRDVAFVFTRNLPSNLEEAVEVAAKLSGLVSKKTRIELLPLDVDAEEEITALTEEEAKSYDVGFKF